MRRLKTYLRSTERLNSVMTLHVHKDLLDCIDDSAVVEDFVACNEVRKDIFGKGLTLLAPLDIQLRKCFQLQGALPPDPRYRLVLRTRHGAPQPLTPSATYGCSRSSSTSWLTFSIDLPPARCLSTMSAISTSGSTVSTTLTLSIYGNWLTATVWHFTAPGRHISSAERWTLSSPTSLLAVLNT